MVQRIRRDERKEAEWEPSNAIKINRIEGCAKAEREEAADGNHLPDEPVAAQIACADGASKSELPPEILRRDKTREDDRWPPKALGCPYLLDQPKSAFSCRGPSGCGV